jgi:DNA-binding CsgD family transcriptional regulator
MTALERTLGTIEAFYDAAVDETLWPVALKKLTDLTASQASSFWVLDGLRAPHLSTFVCINFDGRSIQEYLQQMAPLDPTVRHLLAHPEQSIVHDGILANERDQESRIYYDWHERSVETRFRMVGQVKIAPGMQAGVALHRTRRAGKYELQDIDQFAVLHQHLSRALSIGFRLRSLGAMQQFGMDWLDRNHSAVVLLDEQRRVVFINRSAERLQSIGDGIKLSRQGIALGRKQDNDKLQCLIAQALSPIVSATSSPAGAMRAVRRSGKRPYGIFVRPISKQPTALSVFRAVVCEIITDPECEPLSQLSSETLCALYELTPMEAKMAVGLATGHSLKQIQSHHGISANTVRTHLKQVFLKTGVHRQAELVALVWCTAQLVAPLPNS